MRTQDAKKKRLEHLIRNWEKYRQQVIKALTEARSTSKDELRFLKLKASLAEQIQLLSSNIPRAVAYESKQQLEAMADLVKRHVTLTTKDMSSTWEREDFENTWHQYYIFLNRMRGMEWTGEDVHAQEWAETSEAPSSSRLWSGLGWTLAIATLALAIFVAVSAAGLSFGGTSGVSFAAPASLTHAAQNASDAFGSLAAGLHLVVDPVVGALGAIWSLAIVGAAVVLVGLYLMMRT